MDLSNRHDLSLMWLCLKIKLKFNKEPTPLALIVDEGRKKSGAEFGKQIFHNWKGSYQGRYKSSSQEPLLQIADLLAFCVNRNTHLAMKETKTETDTEFMPIVASMRIRSDDISPMLLPTGFTPVDFDKFHAMDRFLKGLKDDH